MPRLLAHEIAQVAVNLIQNAIQAVREVGGGPKEILVKVRTVKRQAEFSVSDTAFSLLLRTPKAAGKTRP